eukprot:GHVT01039531.1.p1 GENE.GHVT01039531.1~~GHVT01039531.1.p1  ORF type:complete len:147 (+),score=21.44 GHVT01039531.1:979-1419(+)
MGKILKSGRVVVVLNGRMAGKKAVVVNVWDGTKGRAFGHCLIAGVEKGPLKVHKKMSKKKIQRRCAIKPFVKYVNCNHVLPTRYMLSGDLDVKAMVTEEQMKTPETRKEAKKAIKALLQERFAEPISEKTGKASKDMLFFRRKLRF